MADFASDVTPDTTHILNPAMQMTRSTDDEVIVRFKSRGRSSRRLRDESSRGVLADLVFAFDGGSTLARAESAYGEAATSCCRHCSTRA